MRTNLLTFFGAYVRDNIRDEKHNLILWFPVLQCVGILIYFSLNSEPSLAVTMLIVFSGLYLFFISYKKYTILSIMLVALLMGFTASKFKTVWVDTKVLDKEIYLKNITATIKDVNDKGTYKQFLLYEIKGTKFQLDNIRISVRTRVEQNIKIGDHVRLSAKLFPLKTAPSEYAYDFARIAYYQRISATGFATSKVTLYKKTKIKKLQEYIESFRQYIYENLQYNIKRPNADIVSALLIGKKDGIDQKTMDAIRNSGIAHLFAISGLHLSFIAGLFFMTFRNLFAVSETLTLKYNTKKISAFLTILPTTFYLLITGAQISAQRAYIMVILVLISVMIERKYRGLIAIAFAASVILIIEPESILKPGFQMSFSAVLALISSYQINANKLFKIKILRYFISIMISSIIASLATVPYTMYNFNYFSISGIITNLVAIPVVTLVIIPLGIIYIIFIPLGIEKLVVPLIEYPIDGVLQVVNAIADLKYLVIPIHTFPALSIIVITFGLLWLCLWEQNWRFFGIFFIASGVFLGVIHKTPDILVNADNIAIKENNNLLYSLTRKTRNFVVKTWAKQNGQNEITSHTKYNNRNKRLECGSYGCIYSKENSGLVLLAYQNKDIVKNCDSVDLIIQLNKFDYSVCDSKIINYTDLKAYGTHLIWLGYDNIKIKKTRSNRPWHKKLV
ncbi:MAG: ComEC/Rec2 family competence protein [Wolbachia endosymbiont of Tyrophagus putrescentiae]|nr:ComEC/Rec2 family competence protein [Wolbachia endosymbiont of Tyrophagus putrescentiae]